LATNKSQVKAIIFDLDGTLLNTLDSLARCYNRVLEKAGFPVHPSEAYKNFIGDGAKKCVERCLPESHRDTVTVERILVQQQADYAAHWQEDVTLYSGIADLLATLQSDSIPMAVLSNKDHAFVEQCVTYYLPNNRFAAVQGYSNDVPHKPDPTGALRVIEQLGFKANQVAMIGDTSMDILTAHAAGMISIGVLWGFRDVQELNEAGADYIVETPQQILGLL
jgi:phosphoglycolate phosphatase